MKLLLDTHIWLWSLLEPEKLGRRMKAELGNEENELWLSTVSVWEALLLAQKGRIDLRPDPERWVRDVLRDVPLQEAPLNREVAIQSRSLQVASEDPADRFLAATAHVYELTFATNDRSLQVLEDLSILGN